MRNKIKRKRRILNKWYILLILLVILIFISSSYSLWSTRLYINGTVIGKKEAPELPVEIPSQGTDSNGVNRYTSNTNLTFVFWEIYRVVAEEYTGNTITTTIKHILKQQYSWSSVSPTITLTIPNNTSSTFTDGKIELIDSKDTNNVFQNVSYNVSSTTIDAGGTTDVTISGTLKGNLDVADNTYYNFAITYKIGDTEYVFYYNIIILPI